MVISGTAIECHQASHTGAADRRALPVRNRGETAVDGRFDIVDDPLQGGVADTGGFLQIFGVCGIRHVFIEPCVAIMAALHADKDQILVPAVQVIKKAPAPSESGVLVKKQIMTVKEIHDRISIISGGIVIRQIDMQLPVTVRRRIVKIFFQYHSSSFESAAVISDENGTVCLVPASALEGVVEDGKHLGRTIGFPTANVGYDPVKVLPRYGVYIGYLRPEGEKATPSIINIGLHPTLPDGTVTVEAHMLEENENLYGRKAEVLLMDFLRPETRFDSKEALTAQIAKDREAALAWFAAHAR